MLVSRASYTLSSTHQQNQSRSDRIQVETFGRRDGPGRPAGHNARVETPAQPAGALKRSDHPHATAGVDEAAAEDSGLDPQLKLLKTIIEALTGRLVETFAAGELTETGQDSVSTVPDAGAAQPSAVSSGGRITTEYEYRESESVDFRAGGVIETADGQRIEFSVQLQMDRSYVERSSSQIVWGDVPELKDPLVINFDGGAAGLTADRYAFDLNADGEQEQIAGLTPGRAFLVLDRNGNGRVDDGSELLGALSGDAYADLAALDADGNGFVDGGDLAFSQLGLWRPGTADDGFDSLASQHVGALATQQISTEFKLTQADNTQLGQLRATSIYLSEDGRVGTTQQLDMRV